MMINKMRDMPIVSGNMDVVFETKNKENIFIRQVKNF